MKKQTRLTLLGCALLTCAPMLAQTTEFKVQITNAEQAVKANEPVVIHISDLNLGWNVQSVIVTEETTEIPSQLDDLNGDGTSDEIVFLTDVPAKGKKQLTVTCHATGKQKSYPAKVYAEMKLNIKGYDYPDVQSITFPASTSVKASYGAMYHHGPAFESELTAYRLYADNRQSIDIYGKVKQQLEYPVTHYYSNKDFIAQGYGCDVLWAGKSVSLGSFRGWNGTDPTYVDTVALRTEGILAYGPLRTVTEIVDKSWSYQGKKLNMTQRYIQYAGHRDVEVYVSFDKPLQDELFCTGVQKLERDNVGFIQHDGLTGSWGSNLAEKGDTITFKRETVGLGVYVAPQYIQKSMEHTDNYLFLLGNKGKQELAYHLTFCAQKEEKGYKTMAAWTAYLESWKKRLATPCKVEIIKKK